MRTSGTHNEVWMTSIPVAILLFFLTWMYGGPRPALRAVERSLVSFADWLQHLI